MDEFLKTKAQVGDPVILLLRPGERLDPDSCALQLINSSFDIEDIQPGVIKGEIWALQFWLLAKDGHKVHAYLSMETADVFGLDLFRFPAQAEMIKSTELQLRISFNKPLNQDLKTAAGSILHLLSPTSRIVLDKGEILDISAITPLAPIATQKKGVINADSVDPIVAGVLSLVIPGLGQILAGQTTKGALIMALALFTCTGGGVIPVIAAVDAYLVANRKRSGEELLPWQFF